MVEIRNLTGFKVAEKELKKIADFVLKKEGKEDFELSLALVSENEIRKANRDYRKKDRPTDVLSFPVEKNFVFPPGQNKLGEILVCPKQVAINAEKINIGFREEITRVVIHGVLHLLGYDHKKNSRDFFKKQNSYLTQYLNKYGKAPNH